MGQFSQGGNKNVIMDNFYDKNKASGNVMGKLEIIICKLKSFKIYGNMKHFYIKNIFFIFHLLKKLK